MLPKKHRLKTKADFDEVYKSGRKIYSKSFLLIYKKSKQSELPNGFLLPRFGFVASKKVGKAVERNKAKRILREAIKQEFPRLRTNFEIVFVAFKGISDKPFQTLHEEVQVVFKKAGLYKGTLSEPTKEKDKFTK